MQNTLQQAQELIQNNQYDEALKVFNAFLADDSITTGYKAEAWQSIGQAYRDMLRIPEAISAFESAVQLFRETGDIVEECKALLTAAHLDTNTARNHEAAHKCEYLMTIATEHGLKDIVADTLNIRSGVHCSKGDHEKALEDYRQAEDIYNELGLVEKVDAMSLSIAKSYLSLGKPEQAKPYLERGSAFYRAQGDLFSLVVHQINLASSAWLVQDFDTAEEILKDLQSEMKDLNNVIVDSIVLQGLGTMYLAKGDFHKARKEFLKCWQKIQDGQHIRLKIAVLTALSIICIRLDEPAQALDYIALSRDNCTDPDDIETHLVEYYLAIVYLANDKPELAAKHWNEKVNLHWTTEMSTEYEWMGGMLEHILAGKYGKVIEISAESRELAGIWLSDIQQLDIMGRENSN